MTGLSKSRLLAHRQCPKRLWLQINRPDLQEQNEAISAHMIAGTYAGEIARSLYPEGLLIDAQQLSQAIEDTPVLAYDDLEVSHGMMAMDSFAEIMQPDTTDERREHLRVELLKYCERDTWAMVRIAHFFQ